MAETYFISESAYDHLHELAVRTGYISGHAKFRLSGMSRFLERMSHRRYDDTRPDGVRIADEGLLARRRVPVWRNKEEIRKARLLDLSEEALESYYSLALEFNITMGSVHRGGPRWDSMTSVGSAVMEAIGIGWLTARSLPFSGPRPQEISNTVAAITSQG